MKSEDIKFVTQEVYPKTRKIDAKWTIEYDKVEEMDPEDIEFIVSQIEEDLIKHILETKNE